MNGCVSRDTGGGILYLRGGIRLPTVKGKSFEDYDQSETLLLDDHPGNNPLGQRSKDMQDVVGDDLLVMRCSYVLHDQTLLVSYMNAS
jgi:hypothetical protein